MKEQKSAEVTAPKKISFTIPTNFSIKRETLVKFGIGFIIALALVPALDWVIQTSITSQYVAFYKNSDISRASYIKELERQYGSQVANEMLAKASISQAAKERDLKITEEDVTKAIDADKARAGITSTKRSRNPGSGLPKKITVHVRVTVTLTTTEGTATEPTERNQRLLLRKCDTL
jgi:hypothetical protein